MLVEHGWHATSGLMAHFLANWWIRIGAATAVLGWGPLLLFIVVWKLGFISDPNPNPIGLGLLFFFSFWPAVICLLIGIAQVSRGNAANPREPAGSNSSIPAGVVSLLRILAGVIGAILLLNGAVALFGHAGFGPLIAVLLGTGGLYWSFNGNVKHWFR